MKIGKVEGSPKEIYNFFQNNGLDISEYLEKPVPPLKPIWLIIPSIIIIVSMAVLTLFTLHSDVMTFVFVVGCGACVWLAAMLQIKFKNASATVFLLFGALLIMLVAFGVVKPIEIIQYFKDFKK
ncbi:MAG TPA: hypothetical protein VED00_01800 [archaeon]|nr:hypothetical protein [archaeon]